MGLDISSGSNTKKHLFSPNHMRLAQFLMCFLDGNYNKLVADSFHKTAKNSLSKQVNFTHKEFKTYLGEKKHLLLRLKQEAENFNSISSENPIAAQEQEKTKSKKFESDTNKIIEYLTTKLKTPNTLVPAKEREKKK